MIHDHEYNIGDEIYFFDGRPGALQKVKIIDKNNIEELESYCFIDRNGIKKWTHRYYLYDTKNYVIEEIGCHICVLIKLISDLSR
jgi:hypothetical protein